MSSTYVNAMQCDHDKDKAEVHLDSKRTANERRTTKDYNSSNNDQQRIATEANDKTKW